MLIHLYTFSHLEHALVVSQQSSSMFDLQDAQSCSIPLSLHLDIEWTTYGSLVNPQPQIVSIKEVIQTNTSSLVRLTFL